MFLKITIFAADQWHILMDERAFWDAGVLGPNARFGGAAYDY